MNKSEQVGQINNLDINEINERFRIVQRLFDGLFGTFGTGILSITKLLDVDLTLPNNSYKVLTLNEDGDKIEALSLNDIIISALTASKPVFTDSNKKLTSSGTIPLNQGGTGQVTKAAAFDALSPMTTQGDIIFGGASGTGTRLVKSTAFKSLGINSGETAPEWQDCVKSILTAQGDIPYASAANVITRLAKGAANTKLFINAGATAPEWGVGYYLGLITRDLTAVAGDVSYTGIGFKPSIIIWLAAVDDTADAFSIGISFGTTSYALAQAIGASVTMRIVGRALYIRQSALNYHQADVKSMDTDGFTLTYSKDGSPSGTLTSILLALR